jgi:cytochrome c-type biogenesis protein CcmE
MVDDVVDHLGELDGRVLRAHGWVQAGSIVRMSGNVTAFVLMRGDKHLAIWHQGPLPDTFFDQSEVVVRGTLRGEVMFSEDLMSKCGGKYDGARERSTRFE